MPSGYSNAGGFSGRVFQKGFVPHHAGKLTAWEDRACPFCRAVVRRRLSSRVRYCSRRCAALDRPVQKIAGWNRGLSAESDARVRKYAASNRGVRRLSRKLLQYQCEICETTFTRGSTGSKPAPRFCGMRCYGEHRRRAYQNEKHPRFGVRLSLETRAKMVETTTRLWRERPDDMRKALICQVPNKQETLLGAWLDEAGLPYRFVGNGGLVLRGKNPDFVSTDGSKCLIEFFGRRWHEPIEETERAAHFEACGYRTLVIWSNELRDKAAVVARAVAFHRGV